MHDHSAEVMSRLSLRRERGAHPGPVTTYLWSCAKETWSYANLKVGNNFILTKQRLHCAKQH
jgi:hypothetical protein